MAASTRAVEGQNETSGSASESALARRRALSGSCDSALSLVFFSLFVCSLAYLRCCVASPILLIPENMQGPVTVARNIRHLPCISRRTGEEGVCMFAIDCLKANGSHLGTCIDRFYFGSCCQMPEKNLLLPITGNNIDDNIIDVTTVKNKIDNPSNFNDVLKPLEHKVGDETINDKVSEATKTTEIPLKISTFQTVASGGSVTNPATTLRPKPTPVRPTFSTKRPQRPTPKPTYRPQRPFSRPTLKPSVNSTALNATSNGTTTTLRPKPLKPVTPFNNSKPAYKPPPKRPQPTKRPINPPRLNITFISQSPTLRPGTRPVVTNKPYPTTVMYINTTKLVQEDRTTTEKPSSTTLSVPKTTQIPLTTVNLSTKKPEITLKDELENITEKITISQKPEVVFNKPEVLNNVSATSENPGPLITQTVATEKLETKEPIEVTKTSVPLTTTSPTPLATTVPEKPTTISIAHGTINQIQPEKDVKPTSTIPENTSQKTEAATVDHKTDTTINVIPSAESENPQVQEEKPETSTAKLEQPSTEKNKPEPITEPEVFLTTSAAPESIKEELKPEPTDYPPGLVTWSSNVDSVTKDPLNNTNEESWSPITPPEGWVLISSVKPDTPSQQPETKPTTETSTTPEATVVTIPATPVQKPEPAVEVTSEAEKPEMLTENPNIGEKPATIEHIRPEKPSIIDNLNKTQVTEKPHAEEETPISIGTLATEKPISIGTLATEKPVSIGPLTTENPTSTETLITEKPNNTIAVTTTLTEKPALETKPEEERPISEKPLSTEKPEITKPSVEPATTETTVSEGTVAEFIVNVTLTPTVPSSTESVALSTLSTNLTNASDISVSSTVSGNSTTPLSSESTNATQSGSVESTTTPSKPDVNMTNYSDVCGRRLWPEARIVGGAKSGFGRWPWQISLRQWRTSTYLHKCGAALLNENWAITAAHCVEHVPPSELLVRLGEHDLAHEAEPYGFAERRVQIVASHPHFDPATFEYDLALLRFYEPVTFQPNILPVCVPENDDNFVGKTAYVTGWGRLYDEGPLPSVLQEVSVPVINNTACEAMYRAAGYNEHIPNIFICAGWRKGGSDSCEGDSGGPMVLQRPDGRFLLGGVISWGIGCAEPNQPGVYTRISEFREWINQILQF